MLELRNYQQDAVNSILQYFYDGNKGNPICAMPTGTGKSLVIAALIKTIMQQWPSQKIMMLTHVKELIEQDACKLIDIWATAPLGIFSAGLNRKDTALPIIFGGVKSVCNKLDEDSNSFGIVHLLLIDECHLVSPKETAQYYKVITALTKINPYLKVIGFTATHYRTGQGKLHESGGIFTDLCYDKTSLEDFNDFIRQGYLCNLFPKKTDIAIDVSNIKITNGDFNAAQLEIEAEKVTYQALQETIALADNRKSWLVFASGIKHSETIATMLNNFGISCLASHSKLSDKENEKRINAFKAGEITALSSNNKFTTGFDHPPIDLIVMLRPTCSAGLWVQSLGRGTRPWSGKQDCLVLDFAENTKRLGPINDPYIRKPREKGNNGAPVKICESCGIYNNISAKLCVCCDAPFKIKTYITNSADTKQLIKTTDPIIERFKVREVNYSLHNNATPSLKVAYYCELRTFFEWVCFEHTGYIRQKAINWWKARHNSYPPITVASALNIVRELAIPKYIHVRLDTKYPEILRAEF